MGFHDSVGLISQLLPEWQNNSWNRKLVSGLESFSEPAKDLKAPCLPRGFLRRHVAFAPLSVLQFVRRQMTADDRRALRLVMPATGRMRVIDAHE